jgi:hypothetical protein
MVGYVQGVGLLEAAMLSGLLGLMIAKSVAL